MAPDQDFTLGQHNAAIRQLLRESRETRTDIAAIHAILSEQRGERRAFLWFATTAGGVVGAIVAFFAKSFIGFIRITHT